MTEPWRTKVSNWIDASIHCPQMQGWYNVSGEELRDVPPIQGSSFNYAYWDGIDWYRCAGWPTTPNPNVWTFVDGRLQTPKYEDGRKAVPGEVGLFVSVTPRYWRGFLANAAWRCEYAACDVTRPHTHTKEEVEALNKPESLLRDPVTSQPSDAPFSGIPNKPAGMA